MEQHTIYNNYGRKILKNKDGGSDNFDYDFFENASENASSWSRT